MSASRVHLSLQDCWYSCIAHWLQPFLKPWKVCRTAAWIQPLLSVCAVCFFRPLLVSSVWTSFFVDKVDMSCCLTLDSQASSQISTVNQPHKRSVLRIDLLDPQEGCCLMVVFDCSNGFEHIPSWLDTCNGCGNVNTRFGMWIVGSLSYSVTECLCCFWLVDPSVARLLKHMILQRDKNCNTWEKNFKLAVTYVQPSPMFPKLCHTCLRVCSVEPKTKCHDWYFGCARLFIESMNSQSGWVRTNAGSLMKTSKEKSSCWHSWSFNDHTRIYSGMALWLCNRFLEQAKIKEIEQKKASVPHTEAYNAQHDMYLQSTSCRVLWFSSTTGFVSQYYCAAKQRCEAWLSVHQSDSDNTFPSAYPGFSD